MANPAQLLYDLVSEWRGPANQAPERIRQTDTAKAGTHAFWREQAHAVELLLEVEASLDAITLSRGVDVEPFRRSLASTYALVFGFTPTWKSVSNTPGTRKLAGDLDGLRSVISLLDVHDTGGIDETGIETLRSALKDAASLVDEARYLEPHVRGYLLALIHQGQSVISAAAIDDAALRDAALRLSGAFGSVAATNDVPPEKRDTFRSIGILLATAALTTATSDVTHRVITAADDVRKMLPGHAS